MGREEVLEVKIVFDGASLSQAEKRDFFSSIFSVTASTRRSAVARGPSTVLAVDRRDMVVETKVSAAAESSWVQTRSTV